MLICILYQYCFQAYCKRGLWCNTFNCGKPRIPILKQQFLTHTASLPVLPVSSLFLFVIVAIFHVIPSLSLISAFLPTKRRLTLTVACFLQNASFVNISTLYSLTHNSTFIALVRNILFIYKAQFCHHITRCRIFFCISAHNL